MRGIDPSTTGSNASPISRAADVLPAVADERDAAVFPQSFGTALSSLRRERDAGRTPDESRGSRDPDRGREAEDGRRGVESGRAGGKESAHGADGRHARSARRPAKPEASARSSHAADASPRRSRPKSTEGKPASPESASDGTETPNEAPSSSAPVAASARVAGPDVAAAVATPPAVAEAEAADVGDISVDVPPAEAVGPAAPARNGIGASARVDTVVVAAAGEPPVPGADVVSDTSNTGSAGVSKGDAIARTSADATVAPAVGASGPPTAKDASAGRIAATRPSSSAAPAVLEDEGSAEAPSIGARRPDATGTRDAASADVDPATAATGDHPGAKAGAGARSGDAPPNGPDGDTGDPAGARAFGNRTPGGAERTAADGHDGTQREPGLTRPVATTGGVAVEATVLRAEVAAAEATTTATTVRAERTPSLPAIAGAGADEPQDDGAAEPAAGADVATATGAPSGAPEERAALGTSATLGAPAGRGVGGTPGAGSSAAAVALLARHSVDEAANDDAAPAPPAGAPTSTASTPSTGGLASTLTSFDTLQSTSHGPAGSAATAGADTRTAVATQGWAERIADSLRLAPLRDGTEMRLRLDPPGLGHIDLRISLHHDGVRATIVAEHDATRALLTSQQHVLQAALERSDIRLAGFSVDVGSGGGTGTRADEEPRNPQAHGSVPPAFPATSAAPGMALAAPAGRVNVLV